ncbi:unnamed protein product [Cladocopium goreaui]|uniref:TBC domain-containing protein C215.01 n=1 Tax=Cladocopium goreaui TaxID=2562237 RepID=A0A9P1C7G8_9DINO|nr:unnamed protein product [Cladocopium goreaui]|mmetsp:Transcript_3265/g.7583  ORF Transcript_3265/g.7583 Transcript_3265/m.7583 type:complete len:547 (-) Transcript_3265:129-1769(-)
MAAMGPESPSTVTEVASVEVRRFVCSAQNGLQCMIWLPSHSCFVDGQLRLTMDLLELRTLGTGTGPLKVQLGYLRSVSLASKGQLPRPEGLSESWWDFAVLLEFFEPTEAMQLRIECVLLSGDVEARLLCRSLQQLQRFGVPFEPKEELPEWVAARAKAAYASLTSEDVAFALKKWREGSMVRPNKTPVELGTCSGLSLASLWNDATQALWEAMHSPAVLGFKPDPTLAAGWDAPLQGGGEERLEAEAQLTEKWRKILGGRQPDELNRQQMRVLFVLADRIPWQYRLVCWAHWLKVAEEDGQPLEGCEAAAPETCRRQIEKDVPRTRPGDLNEKQRAALGRVLLRFSVLRPKVGYCQGLNFIVAVQLLAGLTEKQTLGGLKSLTDNYCEGYYEESMRGLLRDIAVLDALLLLLLPKIHARFAEVDLPLLWIAAEPLLTLFSRELKNIESICRLWDFFLIEGPCAPFAVFLAYAELAQERNLLTGAAAEDTLGAFRLLLGDTGAIAGSVLRRAALFLAPRPFGGGLNDTLLARLRQEADQSFRASPT